MTQNSTQTLNNFLPSLSFILTWVLTFITGSHRNLIGKSVINCDFRTKGGASVSELNKILLGFLSFTRENPTDGFKLVSETQ